MTTASYCSAGYRLSNDATGAGLLAGHDYYAHDYAGPWADDPNNIYGRRLLAAKEMVEGKREGK